jgi:pimeloyl-ACP methyl ester carboxylesterase
MERIELGGRSLAFEDRGSGEPVLLLHTGFVADSMRPLAEDERLGDGRRLIVYHRRGYGGSAPPRGPSASPIRRAMRSR